MCLKEIISLKKLKKKEEEESKYFLDTLLINWQIPHAVLNLPPLLDVITI